MSDTYQKRAVRFLDLWRIGDWKLKAYGIAFTGTRPEQVLIDAARRVTAERLSASAGITRHYGVGFTGIHQGKTGNFVFVDWWADENELHHHVYVSPPEQPQNLTYMTPTGLSACVWDLHVIGHERDAWVEHVLKRASSPDIDGYLNKRFDGDI